MSKKILGIGSEFTLKSIRYKVERISKLGVESERIIIDLDDFVRLLERGEIRVHD